MTKHIPTISIQLIILLSSTILSFSQGPFCYSGGCSNLDNQYPSSAVSISTSSWQTIETCFWGGDWSLCNVVDGGVYEWSTCNEFGGIQTWDAQLTLFDMNDNILCYHDNSNRASCINAPYLGWSSNFTGQVKILVTESNCQSNSGGCTELVWRRTGLCPDSYEPNDLFSEAANVFQNLTNSNYNTSINSFIWSSTDIDYYTLVLENAGTLEIDLTSLPADYNLDLYAMNQSQIDNSSTLGTVSEHLTYNYTAGTPTVVYIRIYGDAGVFNACDAYTLSIDWVPDGGSLAPVADFSMFPSSGLVPLTVNFTDQSSGSPTSWNWNFDDGNTSTLQNPSHIFTNSGTYNVQLTASNTGGSDTETQTVTVTDNVQAPQAFFSASPTTGQPPLTVQFSNQSTGTITNTVWDFDDGSSQINNQQNVNHTYGSTGTYSPTLTVSGPGGNDQHTVVISVMSNPDPPNAYFTVSQTSGVAPLTVTFYDGSQGNITSRQWNFGDGNSTSTSNTTVSHTYTNPGIFNSTLTVSGPGGNDQFSRQITANNITNLTSLPLSQITIYADQITPSGPVRTASGNVRIGITGCSSALRFDGDLQIDVSIPGQELISGNSALYLTGIPNRGRVDLYYGPFQLRVSGDHLLDQNQSLLSTGQRILMAQLGLDFDFLKFLCDGVSINGTLTLPSIIRTELGSPVEFYLEEIQISPRTHRIE